MFAGGVHGLSLLLAREWNTDVEFADSITVASISSLISNATRAGNITMAAVTATASNGSTFATTVPAVLVNGTTVTSGVTPVPTEVRLISHFHVLQDEGHRWTNACMSINS